MEEIDLKELLEMFWHKRVAILLIAILFMTLGGIYTFIFLEPKYTASTTLVLTKASDTSTGIQTQAQAQTQMQTDSITTTDIILNSQLVSTYSELIKSKKVLRAVISNLDMDIDEGQLRNNIAVSSVEDTELIRINVTNENAVIAAQLANEIAKVFTENVTEIYSINNVHIVDQAEPTNYPSNVNHPKDILIATFIGVVIAGAYVLLSNMLDTTVKSAEDIEKIVKFPILVSIPYYEYNAVPKSKKGGEK